MKQISGLRQNRAQTREDEAVFLRESPLVGRPFVARIPLSTGAREKGEKSTGRSMSWRMGMV
jgi:hypothetical protein